MPCQTSAPPVSSGDGHYTPGLNAKPAPAVFERDPISTRAVHPGPHGLQLVVQLDAGAVVAESASTMRSKRPHFDIGEQPNDDAIAAVVKRRKAQRQSSIATTTTTTGAIAFDDDNDSDARSCSDRINRFIDQIEDVDEVWCDSSQMILVVLNDVMRQVQRLGRPDPDNAEHSALHDEIGREVAQIEHLVHDYASNFRRHQDCHDGSQQDQ